MFGKVKRWLGIEGVKLELILPEEIKEKEGAVVGKIRFYSQNDQTVNYIKVILIEKYTRGKGKEKLIDEYQLGEISLEQEIEVPAEEIIEIDFKLPFELYKSDMDQLENQNFLASGVVKMAKWLRGVTSTYRIEAEARVKGTALNPFDKKFINLS
jgi:hypothetical protein